MFRVIGVITEERVWRICKLKDRQQNGQMKKDKRTNNDLQNHTLKTKDKQHEPH